MRSILSRRDRATVDLVGVDLIDLAGELRRRGLAVLALSSLSCWSVTISELETRAKEAELRAETAEASLAEWEQPIERTEGDSLDLFRALGRIASHDYPEVTRELMAVKSENADLRGALTRAECELRLVSRLMIAPELEALMAALGEENGDEPTGT